MDKPTDFVPSLADHYRQGTIEDLEKSLDQSEGEPQDDGQFPPQQGQEPAGEPAGPATTTRPRGGPALAQEPDQAPPEVLPGVEPEPGADSPVPDPALAPPGVQDILAVRIRSTNPSLDDRKVAGLVRDTMRLLEG